MSDGNPDNEQMHDGPGNIDGDDSTYTPALFEPIGNRADTANKAKAQGMLTAAESLYKVLSEGTKLDRHRLRDAMTVAFDGRTDAQGAWTWKDAYDTSEAAVVLFILEYGNAMSRSSDGEHGPDKALTRFATLEAMEPPETVRSETQVRLQQFSTPLPLAHLAVMAAEIRPTDTVLEPSAGTGIMAAMVQVRLLRNSGGKLILNELGQLRAELLQLLFRQTAVTKHNAEHIGDYLAVVTPDVIVMNPPFSRSPGMTSAQADADVKHVRSAYGMLRPGGRLVSITSAGCVPGYEEWATLFQTARVKPAVVFSAPLNGYNFYSRHGTSFDCRLTVIDRPAENHEAASNEPTNNERDRIETPADLLKALKEHLPARRQLEPLKATRPAAAPRTTRKAVKKSAPRKAPRTHEWGAQELLKYVALDHADQEESRPDPGAYQIWRPDTIRMPTATDHPTSLVQSRAMAAVRHPKPNYRPMLPVEVTEKAKLSDAQLESVVLAGQATQKHLQRHYLVSTTWETAIAVNESGTAEDTETWNEAVETGTKFREETVRFRQGWMLGDGTGAGKGRQVAAIILDNWLRGQQRRSLWLSQSDKLVDDARRDWVAIGGQPSDVIALGKVKHGEEVPAVQGILFCTYATLRSVSRQGKGSRLEQVVNWLAHGTTPEQRDAFEGVIVFDESHAMANASGYEGSRGPVAPSAQGMAGVRLQNALPDARVVYVSATGASTIRGLAYASRLGLWSAGLTPFSKRVDFVEAMKKGGVAALEVVARDLKALGFYQARALAYEGVEIDMLEHILSDVQHDIYNEYADAFAIIHQNMDAAMQITGVLSPKGKTLNANAKAAAVSAFESTKQRFFNHLLCGMKVPTVIKEIENDLQNDRAAVVQLVSTGEALMDRRISQIPRSEWGDLSIDLTPREYVVEYLRHAFPTQLQEEKVSETGEKYSQPVCDDDGRPVESREACQARDMLIEHLSGLPPVQAALDQLLHHFGDKTVAEITGRSKRVVRIDDGRGQRLALQPRSDTANISEGAAFMNGTKRVLVFSMAGGTGRSYHADLSCRNQDRRVHYLLEAGWRADQAIQGLGRTHRTHQASAPVFRPVSTNVKGERRFISTIAQRLDSLGAITRGQRNSQTTMGNEDQALFKPSDNFESPYARAALRQFYSKVVRGSVRGYSAETFRKKTGLRLADKDDELLEKLPPMHQFLNRLLALRIEEQNFLFGVLEEMIDTNIEKAVEAGTFAQGVEEVKADSIKMVSRDTLYADEYTGAETELIEMLHRTKTNPIGPVEAVDKARLAAGPDTRYELVVNLRSKRAGIVMPAASWWSDDGAPERRVRLLRPTTRISMSAAELDLSQWKETTQNDWQTAWDDEVKTLPDYEETRFWLVTGLLLPIWHRLPSEDMRVRRVTTDDGEPLVGRLLTMGEVNKTLENFGRTESVVVSADEIWEQMENRGTTFQLTEGLRLVKRRVMGIERMELSNAFGNTLETLKSLGCRTEVIYYQTRIFAPSIRVLKKVIARYPLIGGGG